MPPHCGLTYYSTALALRVVLPCYYLLLCHNFASYYKAILIRNSVNHRDTDMMLRMKKGVGSAENTFTLEIREI